MLNDRVMSRQANYILARINTTSLNSPSSFFWVRISMGNAHREFFPWLAVAHPALPLQYYTD